MESTIKLTARAGFACVVKSENVEQFLAASHHATLQGTNWSYRVINDTLPAFIEGACHFQFGRPKRFRLEFTPGKGWTQDGDHCNGYIRGS
jgi:hypothetical protein